MSVLIYFLYNVLIDDKFASYFHDSIYVVSSSVFVCFSLFLRFGARTKLSSY